MQSKHIIAIIISVIESVCLIVSQQVARFGIAFDYDAKIQLLAHIGKKNKKKVVHKKNYKGCIGAKHIYCSFFGGVSTHAAEKANEKKHLNTHR